MADGAAPPGDTTAAANVVAELLYERGGIGDEYACDELAQRIVAAAEPAIRQRIREQVTDALLTFTGNMAYVAPELWLSRFPLRWQELTDRLADVLREGDT